MSDRNPTASDDEPSQEDVTNERQYIKGRNAAYRLMLSHCAQIIGIFDGNDPHVKMADLYDENERTRIELRKICEQLGCNDWADNLDLADVVEKHLAPALRSAFSSKG
jgi:hypothetical protein